MKLEVIGRLGCGKTTLCSALKSMSGFHVLKEPVSENPYLDGFYKGMDYSFIMQVYLMNYHFEQHKLRFDDPVFCKKYPNVVMDSTIHSNLIFGRTMYEQGLMSGDEIDTLEKIYNIYLSKVTKSDLLVWVDCDNEKLLRNISHRDRKCERNIQLEYLCALEEQHRYFYQEYQGN